MLDARKVCAIAAMLLGLLVSGCGSPPQEPRSADRRMPTDAALADEIDPGTIRDVTATFEGELGPDFDDDPSNALARVGAAIDEMTDYAKDERTDYPPMLRSALVGALVQLEHVAATNASMRARACSLLHDGYGLLTMIFMPDTLGEQMARLNGKLPAVSPPVQKRIELMNRMPDLKRRSAACILRAPEPKEPIAVAKALEMAGRYFGERGDAVRSNELHERAMERRGSQATAVDWWRLASSRAEALALPQARAALERARAIEKNLPAADRASYERAAKQTEANIVQAERASQLAGKAGQENEIAYALALRDLRPAAAVRPLLEALAKKYPADARPLVALAHLRLMNDGLDPDRVRDVEAMLRRAEASPQRPREYYDLALALAANDLVRTVGTAATGDDASKRIEEGFAKLFVAIPDLENVDPPRAATIRLVGDVLHSALVSGGELKESLTTLLRSRLETFERLSDRHPTSPDVARAGILIGFTVAAFNDPDGPRGLRLLTRDLEPAAREEPALILEQVRLLSGLATRHTSFVPELEPAFTRAAKSIGDRPRPRAALDLVEADFLAARWRTEKQPDFATRARELYMRARDRLPVEDRPRALNNLVVLQHALGQRNRIREDLASVRLSKKTSEHAALNEAILLALDKKAEAEKAFTELVDDSKRAETRAMAYTWLARLAKQRGNLRAARIAAKEASNATKGKIPLERGLLFEGAFSAGLRYAPSSPRLHRIDLSLKNDLWLVLEPAMPEAELKALAAAAPKGAKPASK